MHQNVLAGAKIACVDGACDETDHDTIELVKEDDLEVLV